MTLIGLRLLRWELHRVFARGATWLQVGFFLTVAGILPMAFGATGGVSRGDFGSLSVSLWSAAILSSLIVLDGFFAEDAGDGTLDLLHTTELSRADVVRVKCLAAWFSSLLPLLVAMVALPFLIGMEMAAMLAQTLPLLVGSPALTMISCLAASLTISARSRHAIASILILPLSLPVILLGAGAGLGGMWQFYALLAAISAAYSLIVPSVVAIILAELR